MKRAKFVILLFALIGLCKPALSQTPRGEYLVNAVMACDGCHTPRGPKGFDMTRRFSGGSQVWDEPAFLVRGSNITQDVETGIGSWSVEDIKKLLVDGVRPNGVAVAHQMPFPFYKILTPSDLDAVARYVKTVPAIKNEVPAPVYKKHLETQIIPGADKPFASATTPARRGFYLATIAHCMECHSRLSDGSYDFGRQLGKGGYEMKGPFGSVIVRNISSSKSAGIGDWTDDDIKKALTEGVGRDGRAFKPPMARHVWYAKMTPADLSDLISYLRTIPPVD